MRLFKSDFLNIMHERGFIEQISDETGLDNLLTKKESVAAYVGFDATAPSLHIGSLVQIMMLYWLQKTGHRPIVLTGGATSMIGDPSFRDETRKMISINEIDSNIKGIRQNFRPYLHFGEGAGDAVLENNASWFSPLGYIGFLREIGPHFSVNRMLSFDSVKLRLDREQTLSFLEFNYMILQAYDFTELFRRYGCRLQMGGADQWGNIVNGIDLGRRTGTDALFGLTTPLLTKASGEKMGKSASGAIWLDPEMCTPYDFWQYWRNSEDKNVGRFLRLYTTLPLSEIKRLESLQGSEKNEAKKILANQVTSMLHGKDTAQKAQETARATFEEGTLAHGLPIIEIDPLILSQGIGVLGLFVQSGLVGSNMEARRAIRAGALRVNDTPVQKEEMTISKSHLQKEDVIKLSMGKKKHVLVRAAHKK